LRRAGVLDDAAAAAGVCGVDVGRRCEVGAADVPDNNALAWTCSDGSTQKRTIRSVFAKPLNINPIIDASANKVTGFALNGVNQNVGGTLLSGERIGSMFTCPGVQVTYTGTTYDLSNTPVLPAV